MILLLTPVAAASVQIVVDGHNTGMTSAACLEQGPGTQNPTAIGGYDLNGPVSSGIITVKDNGNYTAPNHNYDLENLVVINKDATDLADHGGQLESEVTLTLDVKPAEFVYYPPPAIDFIFVYDVTNSMAKAENAIDGKTRLELAQSAIKNASNEIWTANKNSTVTIIPYSRDVFIPLESGGLQFNASLLYAPNTFPNQYAGTNFVDDSGIYPGGSSNLTYQAINQSILAGVSADPSQTEFTIFESDYTYYKVNYSMVADSGNPSDVLKKFNDSVDALPLARDTNTQSGLKAAYEMLNDSTKFPSSSQNHRVVVLITDGDANRFYIDDDSKQVSESGSALHNINHKIIDPANFGNIKNVTGYIGEAAHPSDIQYAHEACEKVADAIKDPAKGNAVIYVVGIQMSETNGTPSVNVIKSFENVSSFDYIYKIEQGTSDTQAIQTAIRNAIQSSLNFYAPIDDFTVNDTINTALFDYVPGSLTIEYKLGSSSLTTFSDYKVGSDVDFLDGNISINFGKAPYSPTDSLTSESAQYVIKYKITPKLDSNSNTIPAGDHLHVGWDNKSYAGYVAPHHLDSPNSTVVYSGIGVTQKIGYVPFNTPTLSTGLFIKKEVSRDNSTWVKNLDLPKGGGTAYYKVTVINKMAGQADLDRVADQIDGTDAATVYLDKSTNNLLENASAQRVGGQYSGGILTLNSGNSATFYYNVSYGSDVKTYSNMAVIKDDSTNDYDDAAAGILRSATATVTVPAGGGGGGGGGGNATINNTTVQTKGYENSGSGAELILEKVDSTNTSKKLSATFEIRDRDGNSFTPQMIYKTNRSGHTERIYLTHGTTYTIYETQAPSGYKPVDGGIKVTVNEDLTLQPVDGYKLTNNGGVYTLTIPNDPDAGACKVFHWWWLYALLAVLMIVQAGFLVKKFKRPIISMDKAGLDNKWWIVLLVMILAAVVSAAWFYQYYCHLSDWWVLLPTLLTLVLTPAIYLYNKYFPGQPKM
ncbi:SpaA isopeptide-forming pilin-related protein [Methanolapillus africanus]|uniref:SpaA isopeptide-forming pilin-related protein n=1 Tax=Methanolapillus africanus TaxID=3028297 RepID=UPI0030B8BAFA